MSDSLGTFEKVGYNNNERGMSPLIEGVVLGTKEKNNFLEIKRELFNRLFPVNKDEGFYMKQTIGNCYLIASINAMKLNKYFMDDLYKNIEFSNEDNIFKTKVYYSFHDGEKYSISLKDLKVEKDEYNSFHFDSNKLEKYIDFILIYLVKNIDIEPLINEGKAKYYFDSRNKKRIFFENIFLKEVENQIISQDGEYFDILVKEKKYKSVNAPIGYKILESLYSKKKGFSGKKDTILGLSSDVLDSFLSDEEWEKKNFILSNTFIREKILSYIKDFSVDKYIMTVSISDNLECLNLTPYFEYNNYKMADGHAYSIVGFNKEKNEVEVVNPWDNNKSLYFSVDDFFKIFTSMYFAKRKNTK